MEIVDSIPRLHFEGTLDIFEGFESPLAIPEMAFHIFSYLDPKSLAKVQLTCRFWKRLAADDMLWKPLFLNIFPKSVVNFPNPPSYRDSFRNMLSICQGLDNKKFKPNVKTIECSSVIKVIQRDSEVFYTGSEEGTLKIWDQEGCLLSSIEAHTRTISSICLIPDGVASSSHDFTVRRWKKEEGSSQKAISLKCLKVIPHKNLVTSVKSQGDAVFSIDWEGTILETDSNDSKIYPFEKDSLRTLIHYENKIITGSWSGMLQVIDRRTDEVKSIKAHKSLISGIQVYKSYIIVSSWDKSLSIWDLETLERRYILWDIEHQDLLDRLSFRSKAKVLLLIKNIIVCGLESGNIVLYDLKKNEKHVLKGHKKTITAFQAYENGLISSSFDGTFRVWNLKTKEEVNKIELNSPIICFEMAYGKIIASCGDKSLKFIDFNRRKRKSSNDLKPKRTNKKSRLKAKKTNDTFKRD